MNRVILVIIQLYQWLEPARQVMCASLGIPWQSCRHQPSCSQFAQESFTYLGFWSALKQSLTRLIRCRPGVSPQTRFHL